MSAGYGSAHNHITIYCVLRMSPYIYISLTNNVFKIEFCDYINYTTTTTTTKTTTTTHTLDPYKPVPLHSWRTSDG